MKRWLPWLALVGLVVVALAVGAGRDDGPRSTTQRVRAIARDVRCPTCQGLSAAESDAKASRAIRDEIRARVRNGQTDGEIRAYLVSRYGKSILLKPEATGVSALVWALPVAAFVVAAGGLAVAFARWRRREPVEVTDDDRRLVEEALAP